MKRLFLIVCLPLCLLALLAGGAAAQIDPQDDGVGIYADLAATQFSVTAQPGDPFEVYLLLTRTTTTEYILSWECAIEVPDNASLWGWTMPPGLGRGLFLVDEPHQFQCTFAPDHLLPQDVVVLMTFIVMVTDESPAAFGIGPHWVDSGDFGLPCYLTSDTADPLVGNLTLHPMHPYEPGDGKATFAINAGPLVASQPATLGRIKALYQ